MLNDGESKGIPEKTSASLTMLMPLTVWITTNWKILKEMEIPNHLICLLRNLFAGQEATVRTRRGTTILFKFGKGVRQGCVYCHPAYLTYMQSTSGEMPAWMNHKLESRLLGEMSTTLDMQMIPPLRRETKEPLDEGERGE